MRSSSSMRWRPVTAIQTVDSEGSGDRPLPADNWMPLDHHAAYPDWPSGLCSVVGATSTVMERRLRIGRPEHWTSVVTSPAADETSPTTESRTDDRTGCGQRSECGRESTSGPLTTLPIRDVGIERGELDVVDNYFQPTD